MKRTVVTGIGPMSSLGTGCKNIWDSILKQDINLVEETYLMDGQKWDTFWLHKMKNFNIEDFDIPQEKMKFVKELRTVKKEDLDLYYFLAVISLAIRDSKLGYDKDKNNIGLIITQENPGVETFFEELIDWTYDLVKSSKLETLSKLDIAKQIYNEGCDSRGYNLQSFSYLFSAAKVFDLHGYSLFINNACASGLFAIEAAAKQIQSGASPVVVVAAVDNPTKVYKYLWFKKNNLYANDGITRPFSEEKSGIVFGDGGAAIVLEDLEHALKRGAKIYAEYLGGGFSLEGWKITVPDVSNNFYVRSFKKALENSKIKPEDIDLVNPHGVGMSITDTYEARTINTIFTNKKPLVTALKPFVGHNLGGSALLETAISLMALNNNLIPATLNCEKENKKLNLNIVKNNKEIEMKIIAKMACGFAGFNGVCIFRSVK